MKETFIKIFKGVFFILVWVGCDPQAYANPYDKDEDYSIHQKVSNLFFKKSPKNPATLEVLKNFQEAYAYSPKGLKINLSELLPRSRILLLTLISQTIFTRYKSEKAFNQLYNECSYFKKDEQNSQSTCSKEDIVYSFGNTEFVVRYKPNEMDPGNLEIFSVLHKPSKKNSYDLETELNHLNCESIWKGLVNPSNVDRSQEISRYFIKGYKQGIPCEQDHFNRVFIFFDFQMARWSTRNISSSEGKEIPIASAIINYLKLSREYAKYQLHYLFEKPKVKFEEPEFVSKKIDNNISQELFIEEIDAEEVYAEEVYAEEVRVYNGYNPFEGASWVGETATRNILTEVHKRKVGKSKHENDEDKKNVKKEARDRWINEQAQKWWITECLKLNKEIEETSVEEEAKKRELRDSLECSFIANEKKDQWIQENRKKLDDEYRIISLYYKYFGGISEDDDYLQELEN
ncbi:MAG: hypothetical protein KBC28_03710 [Alphaproteobacteria bacterium]|nr:hypothetical protein [Alphaproteobacteria bacterium]